VNWASNLDQCCAIGMVPLTLESADKSTCLNKMISTVINCDDERGALTIAFKIGMEWQYNWNYWTSGRKSGASYEFCFGTSSQTRHLPLKSYWAPTQPNNTVNEQCVHMGISRLLKVAQLHDKNCAQKYVFACQVCIESAPGDKIIFCTCF